jgi:hypothetical protein
MPLPPNYFVERVLPAVGHAIFDFITTCDATQLRACGTDCRNAVAAHKWHDLRTRIRSRFPAWRACFPRATAANVSGYWREWCDEPNTWVTDADFVHFAGLRELRMNYCERVTDAAFAHLAGIHTLSMNGCDQGTITDAAFVHLAGIHTLNMSFCDQPSITGAGLAHLAGVVKLYVGRCNSGTVKAARQLQPPCAL